MQEENSTLERIQKVFNKTFKNVNIVLKPDTQIASTAGISSFGYVQFLYALEEEFGLKIKNSALRSFKTVQSVIDYIESAK